MKLVRQITRHEVFRRWAIGELYSQFFSAPDEMEKRETFAMLTSEVISEEVDAINKVLQFKRELVSSLSPDIKWYSAVLPLKKKEMDLIYTLPGHGWKRYTKGSYELASAAKNLSNHTFRDERIEGILSGLKNREAELSGITLMASHRQGPFVAIEGNGRLTALYILRLLQESDSIAYEEIEVTLGIYNENN